MQLIPVIDLMDGVVVRGYAGQREHYQPCHSKLVSGCEPTAVLNAFKEHYKTDHFYIADLNAIRFQEPHLQILAELGQQDVRLAVDAGVKSLDEVETLFKLGVDEVIVGLETLPHFGLLTELINEFGSDKLIFSLDLSGGRPLGAISSQMRPLQIAIEAISAGIQKLIVLEFSMIGTHGGVPTANLCHAIKLRRQDVIVWTGGGVRNLMDIHNLRLSHVDGVLIASALHDGNISPNDWQSFQTMDFDKTLLAMDA